MRHSPITRYASPMTPRWEPNPTERLTSATLDLFAEQGAYDTTVSQIAERAELTRSTFFRHFHDKWEVLFADQDRLCQLLAEATAAAPGTASPVEAVAAALEAAATAFPQDQHDLATRRLAAIAAARKLQERDALEQTRIAAAMEQALLDRATPEPIAALAAAIGALAFKRARARWADPANRRPFSEIAGQALEELNAANAALR